MHFNAMMKYGVKRLSLAVPTLISVLTLNFVLVQFIPGGPIDSIVLRIQGNGDGFENAVSDGVIEQNIQNLHYAYEGKSGNRYGIPESFVMQLERQYAFDRPILERYFVMIRDYLTLNFGNSYFYNCSVLRLMQSKCFVSFSLGFWSFLCIYLLAIPLGIKMAMQSDSRFNLFSTILLSLGYAIPTFLLAILFIVFLAGGSFLDIFPLSGLFSYGWNAMPLWEKIVDYFWHLVLPIMTVTITGMSSLVFMCCNSFVEEMHKGYIFLARAKGAGPKEIIYRHIFPNALIPITANVPAHFVKLFLTSNIVVEIIFSLDGLGLLAFDAVMTRDYPVMFSLLYMYTLVSILLHFVGDMFYAFLDPRVKFEKSDR